MDELQMAIAENNYRAFDEVFYYRCRKTNLIDTMMWLDPLHQGHKVEDDRLYTVHLCFIRKSKMYYEIKRFLKLYNSYYHSFDNGKDEYYIEIDFKRELDRKIIIVI